MLKYLLDTNVISEPARPSPNRRVLGRLHRHELEIAIAAPVWHELLYGLRRLPPSPKRTRIASVHNCIVVTANVDHFEPFEGIRIENWME